MKNTDQEGGAPQGGNVVIHVSQIKSILQIYVSNLECKHPTITLQKMSRVNAKSHKNLRLDENHVIFIVLESYKRTP